MDHMEFSIALPPYVEFTNAGMEWMNMKQRLSSHVNHGSDPYHQQVQGLVKAFLINIAADHVQEVFNMFGLTYDEALKFNRVLQRLEDVCLPRFLIIYNRYRFFTCKQAPNSKFDEFLRDLLNWSENCDFGDLKDILLKDCIITGISDDSVRQNLLKTEELDFTKTLEICRAVEQQQNKRHAQVWTEKVPLADACVNTEVQNYDKQMCDVSTNTLTQSMTDSSKEKCLNRSNDDTSPVIQAEPDVMYSESEPVGFSYSGTRSERVKPRDSPAKSNKIISQIISDNDECTTEPLQTLRRSKRNLKSPPVNTKQKRPDIKKVNTEKTDLKISNDVGKPDSSMKTVAGIVIPEAVMDVSKKKTEEFLCSSCGQHFSSHKDVLVHFKKVHGKTRHDIRSLKCKLCKTVCKDLQSLRKHKLTHKGEKRFRCETCSAVFGNPSHLRVHIRLHTGERPFTCDTCGASYPEASKLKAHMRKHTGEKPYKCKICNRTFAWTAAYTRHVRTHTGERPYTCEFCGGSFADFTSLQRHRRVHTKEKPYKCDVCQARFTDPSALKLHKRTHTGERPFSCETCGTSFARSQHLKEHTKLHTGEKPYECETCGARFAEASKLKSHRRKHTGEKPYLCKICGTSFAWTAAYTRHMRTHTQEKPYVCDFCGSHYADHSTLTRHRRTHTGERPYQCRTCSANFADNSSLHRHMRTHTGEKSFTCEVCGSSFAVKSYLVRHMRIHTGEKPYACDLCGSKFTDSSKLNRHKKIHLKAQLKQETLEKEKERRLQQQHQQQQQQQQHQQQHHQQHQHHQQQHHEQQQHDEQQQHHEQQHHEQQQQHYEQLQPLQHLIEQEDHLQQHPLEGDVGSHPQPEGQQSMGLVQDIQHPLLVTANLLPLTNVLPFGSSMIS